MGRVYSRSKENRGTYDTQDIDPRTENRQRKNVRKLRDIEFPNEIRKVFERMLALLLDEVCQSQLSKAQQGFISGREITRNTIKMLHAYATAKDEAEKNPTFEKLSQNYRKFPFGGLQQRLQQFRPKMA